MEFLIIKGHFSIFGHLEDSDQKILLHRPPLKLDFMGNKN